MITEIFGLLASMDVKKVANGGADIVDALNIRRGRIKSISAYSSQSIFYFPTFVSSQVNPEENSMIAKMIEKTCAAFVMACISLMPFHRVRSADTAAIDDYLSQFHQNMGINRGSGDVMAKAATLLQNLEEDASDDTRIKLAQDFVLECWNRSRDTNSDFVSVIAENVSLNDMFSRDPIDPVTSVLQERFQRITNEMNTWGFIGEASDDLYDDEDIDFDDVDDDDLLSLDEASDEGIKKAIDSIKYSLEGISNDTILSANSITKLTTLERKLNTLKTKYTKYLNRYKAKYEENERKGTNAKVAITFNKILIKNPKAFMKQYGKYIKIINQKLKLCEKRRAELNKRKGGAVADSPVVENGYRDIMNMLDNNIEMTESALNDENNIVYIYESEYYTPSEFKILQEEIKTLKYRNHNKPFTPGENTSDTSSDDTGAITSTETPEDSPQVPATTTGKKYTVSRTKIKEYKNRNRESNTTNSREYHSSKVFDRDIFTKSDVEKANEAVPTLSKVNIGFIVDDTNEVVNREILIGVKSYVHRVASMDMINDIYNVIINKRKFLKFVKFVTGEERSLTDLVFGLKQIKADAGDTRSKSTSWRAALKRRQRMSKIAIPYLTKEYTPNGFVVITMNEVRFIKEQYGIDIMDQDHVKIFMDSNYLLGLVIVDQSDETVHVVYDGHGYGFQEYSYAMLERERQTSDRAMRELYRSFNK